MEDVHFAYQMRPNQKVLEGINLTINKGEVCALVGKSGGGKSTLVHLMMRFYDPKQGRITLDGKDLTTLNLRSVHRHCGLVAQDTQLFACSIRDNIAYVEIMTLHAHRQYLVRLEDPKTHILFLQNVAGQPPTGVVLSR